MAAIAETETDDKQCTIDAQPDVSDSRSGLEPGAIAQSNGFTSVPFTSNFAIDSLFGVGASTGGEAEYKCPQDMVLTGVAGGAEPVNYLTDKESYISGLQFRCSNARGLPSDSAAVQKMRSQIKASFPRVAMGRSCRTVNLSKYATKDLNWQGVASRSGVLVNELMRANPDIKLPITSSTPVFLPPCNYGKAPPKRPPVRARAVTMDIDS
ncbi:hypothetical protein OEZ85_012743 [Tetradesmus obliquus]|uniref:LysM domain-containing protein n=1 Tax=Tetradesmus obliquus TaxID=3088 RepID=A0ABY8U483_TETOB|nr:hypothetical protein OEZ85_012743 [Tetradesmus obliquus]